MRTGWQCRIPFNERIKQSSIEGRWGEPYWPAVVLVNNQLSPSIDHSTMRDNTEGTVAWFVNDTQGQTHMFNIVIAPLPYLCNFPCDLTHRHLTLRLSSLWQRALRGAAPASAVHPCMVIKPNAVRFSMRQHQQPSWPFEGTTLTCSSFSFVFFCSHSSYSPQSACQRAKALAACCAC